VSEPERCFPVDAAPVKNSRVPPRGAFLNPLARLRPCPNFSEHHGSAALPFNHLVQALGVGLAPEEKDIGNHRNPFVRNPGRAAYSFDVAPTELLR
jgi:hypothetical protein